MSSQQTTDAVDDVDNLNQRLQIRSINEARSKARDVRNRAQEQIASATKSEAPRARHGGERVYLEVVKAYALELAPLIAAHNDGLDGLWSDSTLMAGTWRHTPQQDNREIMDVEPEAAGVEIDGIRGLIQTDFPVTSRFEVTYRDSGSGSDTVTQQDSWLPSFSETDAVLVELDNARRKLGIYLEGPDEIDTDHSDYGDDPAF